MARKYLIKTYEGTVREVGSNETTSESEAVLDLGTLGRIRLQALTVEEAREVAAALYRPVQIAITITESARAQIGKKP